MLSRGPEQVTAEPGALGTRDRAELLVASAHMEYLGRLFVAAELGMETIDMVVVFTGRPAARNLGVEAKGLVVNVSDMNPVSWGST